MSMNIDKPLDDIVAEKRKSRAPRRPRAPRNGAAAPAAAAAAPAAAAQGGRGGRQSAAQGQAANQGTVHVGDKIIVSNLPTDVDERQIKELFTTTVGPVRTVSLSYNAQGVSKGIATVHFNKAEHATGAYQQYNKRLIDGKRAMKVEVIVDPSRVNAAAAAAQPLTARLGAPPPNSRAAQSATVAAAGGSARQSAPGGAGAGARRGRRGGAGRGTGGDKRPKATLESLDAEMADYQAQGQQAQQGATTAAAETSA